MKRLGIVLGVFVLLTLVLAGLSGRSTSGPATGVNPRTISLAQFNALAINMSYREAVTILGAEGTVTSTNTIQMPEALGGPMTTTLYTWEAGRFANMNATFQNDKLISKAQIGLR